MILQIPWVERTFNFDFPTGMFPVIFSRLEGTIFRLQQLLANADDEYCSASKKDWSVKQHVGHLYDLEELWWTRLTDFQQHKETLTAADMSNKKTHEALHNEESLETLMTKFTIERQKILETIYYFDEQMLLTSALHPRLNKPMRLIDSLFFVAEHDDHHVAVISNLLRESIDFSH
jgi:uncharacterized damage-inducible protein DinB